MMSATQLKPHIETISHYLNQQPISYSQNPNIVDLAYLLEELRISVFAQGEIPVLGKVSVTRFEKALQKIKQTTF